MKNSIVLLALCVSTFIFSQEGPRDFPPREGERPNKEEMLKRMQQKLNLSADQVTQIKKIDQGYDSEEKALRDQTKALHDKVKNLRDRKKAEVEKILTPDQKKKLDEMKEKRETRKGKMKERLKERNNKRNNTKAVDQP